MKAVWIMPPDLDLHCFQINTFYMFLLSSADFFSNNDFRKFIQYLMVWIQIRTNELHVGPDPRPNCSEKYQQITKVTHSLVIYESIVEC